MVPIALVTPGLYGRRKLDAVGSGLSASLIAEMT